ncbi:Sua5/YciO/YrdC/YwlC family protein [Variovorax sp. H27-G14]|uniref:L-threonylcarbamoyladenylate synthase n=1 Tax=Variovorax sp. H27-G14 TaxID=3111914 RepID=UPI0038FCDBF5
MQTFRDVPTHANELAQRLRAGSVMAYPTEAVMGLGCDPLNEAAVTRICRLKQRSVEQGVLLIAADFSQVLPYVDMAQVPQAALDRVKASWPGPFTWIFPRHARVPAWISGRHAGIALRVTAHGTAATLCRAFGGALVSTSANPHGQPAARTAGEVRAYFDDVADAADGIDLLVDEAVGGLASPSEIRDALTGELVRG